MHFYTLNIGDFSSQTVGMDNEQVGIFVRLVNRFVSTEKPITEGWLSLAFQNETKEKLLVILDGLFEKTSDGWVYLPAQAWLDEYQNKVETLRANGKKGGRPRKEKPDENQLVSNYLTNESNCQANVKATNNQEPITNNHINKEIKKKALLVKPEGVSEKVFGEWVSHKKKVSKASLSQRMIDAVVREAGNAGLTTEQAMVIQLENGWTGFKADYVKDNKRNGSSYQRPSFMPRDPEPDWSSIDYGQSCKIKDL